MLAPQSSRTSNFARNIEILKYSWYNTSCIAVNKALRRESICMEVLHEGSLRQAVETHERQPDEKE